MSERVSASRTLIPKKEKKEERPAAGGKFFLFSKRQGEKKQGPPDAVLQCIGRNMNASELVVVLGDIPASDETKINYIFSRSIAVHVFFRALIYSLLIQSVVNQIRDGQCLKKINSLPFDLH